MENTSCCVCLKPKATLKCGICESSVCKYCAQFVDEAKFSFLPHIPPFLAHNTYCGPCFDAKIAPEIEVYDELMERAKGVSVFLKTDSKQTRSFSRLEKPVKVVDCPDRSETIMRLAFLAVKAGFNSVIDVDLVYTKVRDGTYQTMIWNGTGIPCKVTSKRHL